MKIELTILGECASMKNSRQIVKRGNHRASIKSRKALAYEQMAAMQIPAEKRVMMTGPLKVTIRLFYRTERPDLDEAAILDVLQSRYHEGYLILSGVIINDRQIREKHVYHGIDKERPRAEIVLESLAGKDEG